MLEIIPNWHPMFVHFTVASFIVSFVGFLVSQWGHNYNVRYQARVFARWNLWIGMSITLLTLATGFYAYNTVNHDDLSDLAMREHRNWALIAFITFLSLTLLSLVYTRKDQDESVGFVAILFIAVALLASTAWHGAELVYRHGLGVMSLPKGSGVGQDRDDGERHPSVPAPAVMSPADPLERDVDDLHDDKPKP